MSKSVQNEYIKHLIKYSKVKQPDLALLCHLAKKITVSTPLISEIFLPFFKRLVAHNYDIQVQLSEVYSIHGRKEENDYWFQKEHLIPVVAHHWLISQLMINPQDALTGNTTYQLKNALHTINCNTRKQLEELLETLIKEGATIYDNEILLLLERGIKKSQLSYSVCEETLTYLLTSKQYDIVFSTCELLQQYSFVFTAAPEVSLRILMQRGGLYEPLALHTLGIWGNHRLFEEVILGDSWETASKQAVLPFLLLTTSLMDTLVEYLVQFSDYSSDWYITLLNGAHQGVFASKKQLFKLLKHYFEYEFISAKELVQLVPSTSIEHLFTNLVGFNAAFLEKKVNVFKSLDTVNSREAIVALLKETKDHSELYILLEAVSELKIVEAESHIFPFILDHSERCLETLKYIGGPKTIDYLKEQLAFDAPLKENIPSFEKQALTLLADLIPDQRIIINYLQKHKLPHIKLSNLSLMSPVESQDFLCNLLSSEEIEHIFYAIEKLGEIGSLETLAPVLQKASVLNSHSKLPQPVWNAARKIANRAYDRHQLRTKKHQRKIAVDTVLAECILKQLKYTISEVDAKLYLSYLSEVIPIGFSVEKLSQLSSSRNPHIVKFYLSYLGKINDSSSLIQLKEYLNINQDIYTLRQSIMALTTLNTAPFNDLVIPLLNHRNMNIKKTVADYLIAHSTVKAIPAMFRLFQGNDNSGLRKKLEQGLRNVLGEAYHFFLFNECSPCEVAWQHELMGMTIENDDALKKNKQYYIDFPSLGIIASEEKISYSEINDEIQEWISVRKRTKEDLALLEDGDKFTIDQPRGQSEEVFVNDLIASFFREINAPPSYYSASVLTTEEARLGIANAEQLPKLWDTTLLDPESEYVELENLTHYKELKTKEKLFFHFLSHYSLEHMFAHLSAKKDVSFMAHILTHSRIAKYTPLLIDLMGQYNKEQYSTVLSALQNAILKSPFINEMKQTTTFFLAASVEEKINKLASYPVKQQSLLKEKILDLYNTSSWKQRDELLESIKKPESHTELLTLSFTHYLTGKKLPFWDNGPFNQTRIQQIEDHPDGIEMTKKRSRHLKFHSDQFILTYVKDVFSDQEADKDLLSSFRQFSTERKWKILKSELEQENWYWLSFFNALTPVNTELKALFQQASSEGKLHLVQHLLQTKDVRYFPDFENLLLPFVAVSTTPTSVWQLLFELDIDTEKKEEIITAFIQAYKQYNGHIKVDLLTHFIQNDIPKTIVDFEVFRQVEPGNEKEESLLLQLQLKALDNKNPLLHSEAIDLIKQLAKLDSSLANHHLAEVIEHSSDVGLAIQMNILDACYSISSLEGTVTNQIAHLFSADMLALSFLTEDNRSRFYQKIEELLKAKNSEIDIKGVLKNLSDESPKHSEPLLLAILSIQKKTDLDALCLRLLKKVIPKSEYLDVCRSLLSSDKEDLFQSIIRTLSFTKYTAAIPNLVKLLFHKKGNISKAAQQGLFVIGEEALPLLIKELNKARPDNRSVLNELIEKIKREE